MLKFLTVDHIDAVARRAIGNHVDCVTATHSKVGTVHTLNVKLIPHTSRYAVIKFIASAKWTVGDTFTIPGVGDLTLHINYGLPEFALFNAGDAIIATLDKETNTIYF